jgi:hypothetical protein
LGGRKDIPVWEGGCFGLCCLMPLSTRSQLYHDGHLSFIVGGNRNTRRIPQPIGLNFIA